MAGKKVLMHITAETDQMKTEVKAGKFTIVIDEPKSFGGRDLGPNPLEVLLAALSGCENVIANMVAKEMKFDLQGMSFDIKGDIDPRGLMGDPTVKTYFDKVTVEARVKTSESQERLQELAEKTEQRCPVYSVLKAAGIEMEAIWVIV